MAELTLISESPAGLRPIIERAFVHESGVVEIGIRQTEHRLRTFERRYAMNTSDFIVRYEQDQLDETLDFAEWIGEFSLLERLRENRTQFFHIGLGNKLN